MTKLFLVTWKNDFGVTDQWFAFGNSIEEVESRFEDCLVEEQMM